MAHRPKSAHGLRRIVEVCCVAWIDLLGYGPMLRQANFDPTDVRTARAVERLTALHSDVARHSSKYSPSMVMNDGAAFYRDLSARTSPWVEKELNAPHVREFEKRDVFILPILYKDCEIPPFVRDKIYADFRVSYEEGLTALLGRLSPPIDLQILKGLMSEDPSVIFSHFSKIRQENKERYLHALMNKLTGSSVGDKLAALTALYIVKDSRVCTLLFDDG